MKATELMIGDWVYSTFCDKPCKVIGIEQYESEYVNVKVTNVTGAKDINSIYFIPLTAEILEKNGFSKQKWNDLVTDFVFATDLKQSPQTVIQFSFYSKEIEGVKSLLKMWTKSKFGHGQNDVHLCGVYYVHELQHALRLCGIDKEIVL